MMTLGNMRENGVRSLAITCVALWCHHEAILDAAMPMTWWCLHSARVWFARSAATSVRVRGRIGMNVRR
jgi:hypothetical protein